MLKAKHDRNKKTNNPSTGKKEERDSDIDWQAVQNKPGHPKFRAPRCDVWVCMSLTPEKQEAR